MEHTIVTTKETQDIITPYAFAIPESLMGMPLAKPWKRALAMAIDLLLVVLLSYLHFIFLALAVAVVFYRLGSGSEHSKLKKPTRKIVKIMAALLIFFCILLLILVILEKLNIDTPFKKSTNELAVLKMASALIETSNCPNLACWEPYINNIAKGVSVAETEPGKAKTLLWEIANDARLDTTQKNILQNKLMMAHGKIIASKPFNNPSAKEAKELTPGTTDPNNPAATPTENPKVIYIGGKPEEPKNNRLIGWIKGFIEELGLGFSWAALYFSALTTWWHGKTVGKKILCIRTIQLNGKPLTLWNAFGRYGGYSAGLATGLLGFLQIYWDPNRQAIQDKIATTVVVDERRNA